MKFQQCLVVWLVLAGSLGAAGAERDSYAGRIASLIDPVKLAKLGERQANPRVQKYVAQLAEAKAAGLTPAKVAKEAVVLAGMKGEAANLTVETMLRNLKTAQRLGCLDKDGLHEMRQGQAATVRRGPYSGEQLSVDHVIPWRVAPELGNVMANLELLPLRANEAKNDRVGARQRSLAKRLHTAGLLSAKGLKAVSDWP